MRIAKAGYYGGDPQRVLDAGVSHVLNILEYEAFTTNYERAYIEMSKEKK